MSLFSGFGFSKPTLSSMGNCSSNPLFQDSLRKYEQTKICLPRAPLHKGSSEFHSEASSNCGKSVTRNSVVIDMKKKIKLPTKQQPQKDMTVSG